MAEKETFSRLTLAACGAAVEAGEILREGYGTDFEVSSKEGKHNLVTEYDFKAEKRIISFLSRQVPNSHFLAEESGATGAREDLLWIIDPLDGTVNFAHGIPVFSVSIALESRGEIISGVVYQPLNNELFVAEKGKGAFLYTDNVKKWEIGKEAPQNEGKPTQQKTNFSRCLGIDGKRIRVSPVSTLEQSILATGFPYNLDENPFQCIEHFIDIVKLGIPIRRLGSAAIDLAYTAAGRFEGFFEVGLKPWDCAAGILLIEEAGGRVTHWDKKPFNVHSKQPILATNGLIHDRVSAILHRHPR